MWTLARILIMKTPLPGLLRTHHCGELRDQHVGQDVSLCGWVNKYRDLGGLHFIDLRDKYGLTQINFSHFLQHQGTLQDLKIISLESTIRVKGKVVPRPPTAQNNDMPTGQIEIMAEELELLSASEIDRIPFLPYGATEAVEDLKLKYRYLDLRTKKLQDILTLRAEIGTKVRATLNEEGFTEVETPILYKSTPEGARDYVVPSRVQPGKVYALPQSPQTLKQLLMIGGTDKYYQIARCFRDEDLRADRQPEFTQIDIEVSFVTAVYIRHLTEKLIKTLFPVPQDFTLPMMDFKTALNLFGSDKPDLRFGLQHMALTGPLGQTEFGVWRDVASKGGLIKGIFLPQSKGTLARKDLDQLPEVVKPFGGKGVSWFKVAAGERSGGASKFLTDSTYGILKQAASAETSETDGLWFFLADQNHDICHASADALRRHLGQKLKLHAPGYHFLWVYDFPLYEWNEEEKRFYARHHPFTGPRPEMLEDFMSGDHQRLKDCLADAYDLVCNGYELGGGSIRIYRQEVQAQMFRILGFTEDDIRYQFGFFIDALRWGTPPHGGIAFGLDRITMLLAGTDNIRDVIAFPKTTSATDLMAGCPSSPNEKQCRELHFKWLE
jgi:aspartyl-tRNA synthetase